MLVLALTLAVVQGSATAAPPVRPDRPAPEHRSIQAPAANPHVSRTWGLLLAGLVGISAIGHRRLAAVRR